MGYLADEVHETMYDDILIPTDGSDTVRETLEHALPIAQDNDATVHALYVVDSRITAAAGGEAGTDLERSLTDEGEEAIAAIREQASEAGLETATRFGREPPRRRFSSTPTTTKSI